MASPRRLAGLIGFTINGEIQLVEGDFTYNPGAPKREALVGADRVHGFKETPQVAFIEGTIRDRKALDIQSLYNLDDATVALYKGNEKVFTLRDAWFAGEGTGNTGDAKLQVRFEGISGEETS
jgi:hypothetical protein